MTKKSATITFARGARRVTGANFLVEANDGATVTRMLVDCGLAQGERFCESVNSDPFSYDPTQINHVLFTHAHADHIGLFPKLVKEGFSGSAYATAATRDLLPIMLEDTVYLMAAEAKRCNDVPPYQAKDVESAVRLLRSANYGQQIELAPNISATFYNAGHILGSATILLDIFGTRVLFTGDLGRKPAIMVPDREVPKDVDVLITESVYGNRLHGSLEESLNVLLNAVRHAEKTKGVLLIPSFSLERTQIILSLLDRAISENRCPAVPIFMDSPLAAKGTDV